MLMQNTVTADLNDITAQDGLPPPETVLVYDHHVYCDGAGDITPALGHPRIYLTIPVGQTHIDCGYCDRRFTLKH